MIPVELRPSPNFNDRPQPPVIDILVLHYTGMGSAEAAIRQLCSPEGKVSSHYVVDESGHVLRLVDEEKRAWHAGVSSWAGITDLNGRSIGIEIVNGGHDGGSPAMTGKHPHRAHAGRVVAAVGRHSILLTAVREDDQGVR